MILETRPLQSPADYKGVTPRNQGTIAVADILNLYANQEYSNGPASKGEADRLVHLATGRKLVCA